MFLFQCRDDMQPEGKREHVSNDKRVTPESVPKLTKVNNEAHHKTSIPEIFTDCPVCQFCPVDLFY